MNEREVLAIIGAVLMLFQGLLALMSKMNRSAIVGGFHESNRRLSVIESSMVTRELCDAKHEPLEKFINNGFTEQLAQIRERVSSLETTGQRNHEAIEALWKEVDKKRT